MCPDPQLLSVYMDGEMPSPWKEKMENHLTECSACKEKLDSYRQIVDKHIMQPAEKEIMETAKDRVWQNLQTMQRFQLHTNNFRRDSNAGLWRRRLSVPLPAAAAAAVVIILMAGFWLRDGQVNNDGFALQQAQPIETSSFFFAANSEIPSILPSADINDILQFLASDGSEIIILNLPESTNFYRTGEPAIIRAADYTRHNPEARRFP